MFFVLAVGLAFLLVLGSVGVSLLISALRARRIARADVSSDWRRKDSRQLEVNLERLSLSGTRLGGDIHGLSFLGPAEENEDAPEGFLHYTSRKLTLVTSEERLTGFSLLVAPASEPGTQAILRLGGEGSKQLHRDSTEQDIVAAFGAPYWRRCDPYHEGEVTLYFERFQGDQWVELQFEFDAAGRLEHCEVITPPSLADPQEREDMGVTASWPPAKAAHPPASHRSVIP